MKARPTITSLCLIGFVLLTAFVPSASQSMTLRPTTVSALSAANDPPSGLVSWWPGDGYANDIAGHNHGYLQSGTTYDAGYVDQGFSFDGVNGAVSVPDDATLSPQQFTIDGWVRFDAFYVGPCLVNAVVAKGQDSSPGAYLLGVGDEGACGTATGLKHAFVSVRFSDVSVGYVQGVTLINQGVFYHLGATWDGTTLAVYVNGALDGQATFPGKTLGANTSPFMIGQHPAPNFPYVFRGIVDEVQLFNRALSANEVSAIDATGSQGYRKVVYAITGRVTDVGNVPLAGVTISAVGQPTQTDSNGYYTLNGLTAGSYTLTPSKTNYLFSPPTRAVTVPPTATLQNFTAIVQHVVSDATVKYSYDPPPQGWETVGLDDSAWPTVDAPSSGPCGPVILWYVPGSTGVPVWGQNPNYQHIIYVRKSFYLQSPTAASIQVIVDDDFDLYVNGIHVRSDHDGQPNLFQDDISAYVHSGLNVIAIAGYDVQPNCESVAFDATIESAPVYTISGRVTDANNAPIPGVTITAKEGISTTTDSAGNYTITNLVAGDYTLTPTLDGYTFTPVSLPVSMPPDALGQNFKATPIPTPTPTNTSTPTVTSTPTIAPTSTVIATPPPSSIPSLSIFKIEVSQAIQCLENSNCFGANNKSWCLTSSCDNAVPLVKGKPSWVRVYLNCKSNWCLLKNPG